MGSNQLYGETDMDYRDRLAINPQLSSEQHADLSCVQIYSFERYIGSVIICKQTQYTFIEIFVEFIKGRPTSVLELVLENDHADVYKSNQFKEHDLVHWNIDTSVHFTVSSFSEID